MSLVTFPRQFLVDANGSPRVGARAYFYQAGTTTEITTYTTPAYAVAHANPVLSLASGLFPTVYVNPSVNSTYKMVITDSDDVAIYTEDNIPALGFTKADIGSTLYEQTEAEASAGVIPTAYYYPPGNVKRYGAVGDGETDDTAAIQAALSIASGFGTGILGLNTRSTGPGRVYFPRGCYVVSDTLYFKFVRADFDRDAWIYVPEGDFNVMRFGLGADVLYPKILIHSTTFSSAAYYVSGEDEFNSTDDGPTVLFPYAQGNADILTSGSRAFYLHALALGSGGNSSVSFCRFIGPKANYFDTFVDLEGDGSLLNGGVAYVNSNVFRDFVYSYCRYGINIDAHDGSSGVVANELHGQMNAHISPSDAKSVRVLYANSVENVIDVKVWDWNVLELPTTDVIVLDTGADRNDIRVRGLRGSRMTDGGENNWVWMSGTSGGGAYQSFGGVDISAEMGSFTGTLTGFSGTNPSGSVNYVRDGNLVTLTFPSSAMNGTSNSTSMTLTGLPEALWPVREKRVLVHLTNNSTSGTTGIAVIGTGGTVTFGVGGGTGGFTSSGTKGMGASMSFTYGLG